MLSIADMFSEHYAFLARQSTNQDQPLPPHVDVYNPGTSNPAFHQRPNTNLDQTTNASISSASAVNSDGQEQRLDLNPGGQGVGVIPIPMLAPLAFNGNIQTKALTHVDQGVQASVGAPPAIDVSISGQSFHVAPLETSVGTPPAKNVDAGKDKIGGLPHSFNIR